MELKKVKYSSALFFGILAVVMYLLIGILQLIAKKIVISQIGSVSLDQLPAQAQQYLTAVQAITPLSALIITPVIAALVTYIVGIAVILVYNTVAKKYPISWEISK